MAALALVDVLQRRRDLDADRQRRSQRYRPALQELRNGAAARLDEDAAVARQDDVADAEEDVRVPEPQVYQELLRVSQKPLVQNVYEAFSNFPNIVRKRTMSTFRDPKNYRLSSLRNEQPAEKRTCRKGVSSCRLYFFSIS